MKRIFKRIISVMQLVAFGSSGPGAIPSPRMNSDLSPPMTRQKLNELLNQTPSLPTGKDEKPIYMQ